MMTDLTEDLSHPSLGTRFYTKRISRHCHHQKSVDLIQYVNQFLIDIFTMYCISSRRKTVLMMTVELLKR